MLNMPDHSFWDTILGGPKGCQNARLGTVALWCVQWRLAVDVCAINPSAAWSWLCTAPSARDKVHRDRVKHRDLT